MFLINGNEPSKEELLSLFEGRELLVGRTPFTTALGIDERIPFWEHHLSRLQSSFEFLYSGQPFDEMKAYLDKSIEALKGVKGKSYIRFTMIKGEKGVQLISQIKPLNENKLENLKLKSVPHPGRVSSLPNFLKYGNYLESIGHVEKAKEEGFDDCLFLDSEDRAKESSVSNIFFRKGKRIFTPDLKGPILDGVTRKIILEVLEELSMDCEELSPSRGEWESMDEVFITSSTRGPVCVSKIDSRDFEVESEYFEKIRSAYIGRLSKS